MRLSREFLGLATPAVYHTVLWQTQNTTGGGCRTADGGAKPDRSHAQRTRVQWKFGVKHWWFLHLGRIEVGSCSHHKRTEFVWNTSITLRRGPKQLDQYLVEEVVSVWLFWSPPLCDWCIHTFPNKLHHGAKRPGFDWTKQSRCETALNIASPQYL